MNKPLRVLFSGVPDAGKSTLIGRILLETKSVLDDQHQSDLAFYTDGLADEQSKGMTIDVAYRTIHLKSGHRVILIDTPGHSELMSNFISGASYADVIFYLVDSTRPHLSSLHLDLAASMKVSVVKIATKIDSPDSQPVEADYYIDSVTNRSTATILEVMYRMARYFTHE